MNKLGPELMVTVTSSDNASRYFSKVVKDPFIVPPFKLCGIKQYYMNGEILHSPNGDYVLLRVSGIKPFPSMLYALGSTCIGNYAIIDAETGRVVCTREIFDYDLKVLGYKAENALSGDLTDMLHYNGGARLTEYMNRIRLRRLNTR